jgi:hypothetical protein
MAMKRLNFEALPSEDSLAIPVWGGDPPIGHAGIPGVHYSLNADFFPDDNVALPVAAERQPEPWSVEQWKRVQPNPNSWISTGNRRGYRMRQFHEAGVFEDEEANYPISMHNKHIEDLNQRVTDATREMQEAYATGDVAGARAANERGITLVQQKRAAQRNARLYGRGSQRDSKMELPAHPGTPRKPRKPGPSVRIVTL